MAIEAPKSNQEEKKVHKTHFPVIKIPLRNTGHKSPYEWIDLGNGRQKLVPNKKAETNPEKTS